MERFRDRVDAGRRLASALSGRATDPIILALPRGGVPIGREVANALDAPLEVFVARKVGAPIHPEFGIGAVAEGGVAVRDEHSARAVGVDEGRFAVLAAAEEGELQRRIDRYRHGRELPSLEGRDVILVDDGLATGVTAEAALRALRACQPRRLILAVPVAAPSACARLAAIADAVVCLRQPRRFSSVGEWYDDFSQVSDAEVEAVLG